MRQITSEKVYLPLTHKEEIQKLVPESSELYSSVAILEGIVFWMVLGSIFFGVTFSWNLLAGNDVITLASLIFLIPFIVFGFRKKRTLTKTKKRLVEIDTLLRQSGIQNVSAEEKFDPVKGLYYTYTVMMKQMTSIKGDGTLFSLDPMDNKSYR